MTPERLREMQTVGSTSGEAGGPAPDYWRVDWVNWLRVPMLTFGELRALLAIAQRAGETCEWVWFADNGEWTTACHYTHYISGNYEDSEPYAFCPYCGRTVAVRDGRT